MNSSVIKVSDTTFVDTMLASAVAAAVDWQSMKKPFEQLPVLFKIGPKKQTNKELKD